MWSDALSCDALARLEELDAIDSSLFRRRLPLRGAPTASAPGVESAAVAANAVAERSGPVEKLPISVPLSSSTYGIVCGSGSCDGHCVPSPRIRSKCLGSDPSS